MINAFDKEIAEGYFNIADPGKALLGCLLLGLVFGGAAAVLLLCRELGDDAVLEFAALILLLLGGATHCFLEGKVLRLKQNRKLSGIGKKINLCNLEQHYGYIFHVS